MTERRRLDMWLLDQGQTQTRSRAQALIMAGKVMVNGRIETKSGRLITEGTDTVRVSEPLPFVSRGGAKLAHALDTFRISPVGWSVIDIGASTGGFTDCWLQRGVGQVFAVDVGYGQLEWRLRQDPRVVVMDRTNARYLTRNNFPGETVITGASIDASFISLRLLLPPLLRILEPQATVIALVKPQFEAGRGRVGKGGVVKDAQVHEQVLFNVIETARAIGFEVAGLTTSPIRGPEGNIEFLLRLGIENPSGLGGDMKETDDRIDIPAVVQTAWKAGERDG